MNRRADEVLSSLPPAPQQDFLPLIRTTFLQLGRTIVVLDDDPTGTQTCYDVVVVTSWRVSLLVRELRKNPSILFILTNSRSLGAKAAEALAFDVGRNLLQAARESGREITVISRSDSTLRGHFPVEVDAIAHALGMEGAVRVLIPAFIEGGRITIEDVHYIREGQQLIPVAETPFAKDPVFGYVHSNLKEWVEEKTQGKTRSSDVVSISLEDIRLGGWEAVTERLMQCVPGQICIINACTHRDLEIVALALLHADKGFQRYIYRTSATIIPLMAGMPSGKSYYPSKGKTPAGTGSLVIVGSYVPKTTKQLQYFLDAKTHRPIEVNVREVLGSSKTGAYAETIVAEINQLLGSGQDVVVHTSRVVEKGPDAATSLRINSTISSFLVSIVRGITVRPKYIVAKGGITSSDIATQGLAAETAVILGQIIPGVPVWRLDAGSRFPEMIYVVFPGNVGDDGALEEVCRRLSGD